MIEGVSVIMEHEHDCQPKDLSMKCNKRLKPIPPPLNLGENSSALKEFAIIATSPKSPLMQKNLPFRKRAHSLSTANEMKILPLTAMKNAAISNATGTYVPNTLSLEKNVCSIPNNVSQMHSMKVLETVSYCGNQGSSYPIISVAEGDVSSSPSSDSCNVIHLQNSSICSPSWSPTPGQVSMPTVSSVLMSPVGSSREELSCSGNIHPWPAPVWHCFQPGTLVKLDMPMGGNNTGGVFRLAEELGSSDWVGALQVEQIEEDLSTLQLCLHFCCLGTGVCITTQCHSLHTFFVKDKGWCAVYPDKVTMRYQILCQSLERGDICYPPQSLSPDVCDRFKRFSFPPEEITMPAPFILSPPSSPCKKLSDSDRPKRPMNAFMLFAKRYRLELIQMHPGKDNRAISVILGEAWRKLPPADKEEYVLEARAMAQEQKRLHPDCWKRKRSHSTS